MWSINDKDGPVITDHVYSDLFNDSEPHHAVKLLRINSAFLPFIHRSGATHSEAQIDTDSALYHHLILARYPRDSVSLAFSNINMHANALTYFTFAVNKYLSTYFKYTKVALLIYRYIISTAAYRARAG